jgi:hypothetical protein
MYTHIYTTIHKYEYKCKYIGFFGYFLYIYVYVIKYKNICMHVYIYIFTCIYIYNINTYIYIYIYIYTYKYIGYFAFEFFYRRGCDGKFNFFVRSSRSGVKEVCIYMYLFIFINTNS